MSMMLGMLVGVVGYGSMGSGPASAPNELLIKVKPGRESQVVSGVRSLGGTVLERYNKIGWVRVRTNPRRTIAQAETEYRRASFVQTVERNLVRQFLFNVNDPRAVDQWHINRIMLPTAWDLNQGADLVKIGILDSGVELTHPDLVAKLLPGRDTADDDNDPSDQLGHGTHVAGIAAAATNNGIGGAGVGFNTKIIPVKVGNFFILSSDWIEGTVWATDQGANVLNMSFGGPGQSQAEQDAINYATNRNVLVVAAAGNDGSTERFYPAAYQNVLSVASSDPDDSRSGFSNYGSWVTVAAPGNNILSTELNGSYQFSGGTSMASPVVAGLAGLVYSFAGNSANRTKAFNAIVNSADPVPGQYVQYGRVNAWGALRKTVISVADHFQPNVATMFAGTHVSGDLDSLRTEDLIRYIFRSQSMLPLGNAGGVDMTFNVPVGAEEYYDYRVTVSGSSTMTSTGMVWLFNNNTNRWDFARSFPIRTTESTLSVALMNNMAPYIAGDGTMRLRFRAHVPTRRNLNQFTANIDRFALSATYDTFPE